MTDVERTEFEEAMETALFRLMHRCSVPWLTAGRLRPRFHDLRFVVFIRFEELLLHKAFPKLCVKLVESVLELCFLGRGRSHGKPARDA